MRENDYPMGLIGVTGNALTVSVRNREVIGFDTVFY